MLNRQTIRLLSSRRMACCRLLMLTLAVTVQVTAAQPALTLDDVTRLALDADPSIAVLQARTRALYDRSIAAGQLPDPQLKSGLYNLPLDDFSVSREPTTQLRVGVMQAFPRGKTLHHRRQRGEWQAMAEQAETEATRLGLIRDVRSSFLELYYQLHAERIVDGTRKLFTQLVDITQAHYATGRVSQQDVLRASLELSRLDDRTTTIRNAADRSRAELRRWIGDAVTAPIDEQFPVLPEPPAHLSIASALPEHPLMQAQTAKLAASNQNIQIAREQYKPGWSAGLEYRKRFGDDPGGSDRADMMAAMVTIDLPLFTEKRQDRRLSASIHEAEAAERSRDDRLHELRQQLDADYANWLRLGERASLYATQLLKESSANTRASLNAYQSGTTEFATLMRARITDLDLRLDELRIRVDRAKAQANLLYLAGGMQ